jgi:hypothetical protein
LLKVANDTAGARWQRGKAAYAAGLSLEQSGDTQEALVAFRQAFELTRSVFPTYAGISTSTRSSRDRGVEHIESDECGLLRDAFDAVRRLDPDTPDALTGGLRFRIEGVQLPPGLVPKLRIDLFDQSVVTVKPSDRRLPRLVPIPQHSGFVGVADGRYRFAIRYGGSYSSDDSARVGSLLELDLKGLPNTVEIRGNTLELLIPARLSEEITLMAPANNATIDLRTDFFRWSKIDAAAYYKVVIVKKENRVGEGRYYTSSGSPVQVRTNSMCLGTVPETDRDQADALSPGTSAAWQVHAFDADGRRIGTSVQADRTFLVGKGLRNE